MKRKKKALPTIWEIPDELWKRMAPLILEMDPPKETGRPRANPRNVMDAIIFRIRTGCQWNHIPRVYGDDSTIHRTFQHWVEIDLFPRLWALLVEECEEFGLVDWEWQAADSAMGKARLGGDETGPNPTDRAKNGSKKSILTDRHGVTPFQWTHGGLGIVGYEHEGLRTGWVRDSRWPSVVGADCTSLR